MVNYTELLSYVLVFIITFEPMVVLLLRGHGQERLDGTLDPEIESQIQHAWFLAFLGTAVLVHYYAKGFFAALSEILK